MYATTLHCVFCGTKYPLTHRGSCMRCAGPGEESALHETLAVQYDVAALKCQLDREELARRPAGLWLCWLLRHPFEKIGILCMIDQVSLPKHVRCEYN